MWAIAFLGAASAFVESTLAQVYKQQVGGEFKGGPAYYIEKCLGVKWYAVLFAIITIASTGFYYLVCKVMLLHLRCTMPLRYL